MIHRYECVLSIYDGIEEMLQRILASISGLEQWMVEAASTLAGSIKCGGAQNWGSNGCKHGLRWWLAAILRRKRALAAHRAWLSAPCLSLIGDPADSLLGVLGLQSASARAATQRGMAVQRSSKDDHQHH